MQNNWKYRYIAIEGPIGAGKTGLARRLAEHSGADLLLEQPQNRTHTTSPQLMIEDLMSGSFRDYFFLSASFI